jgi:hypothetical protein
LACSGDKRPSSAPGGGADGSVAGNSSAHGGTKASAGADAGGAPGVEGGQGNAAGDTGGAGPAGADGGGTAGSEAAGGAAPDPIPPEGDPPTCAHGLKFGAGVALAISATGDDLLQAITPDELTIAWKTGDQFYVADRDDVSLPFGTPLAVVGSAQYSAVALSPDGLQLVGIKQDLSIVEQTRGAGEAFSDAAPAAGDFQDFNTTRSSIPLSAQGLADPVVAADDASFFYSHFTSSDVGSHATVFESHRSGAAWSFSSADLGKLLYADGLKRRMPSGVSSDGLTLFYFDQVNDDFRAAWRVNLQVPFDYSEKLALGTGVRAAAPSSACARIYFSAQGAADLDLFVAEATP